MKPGDGGPLDPKRPSEMALDIGCVPGWRAPVRDFTGTDELDLERQDWIHEHPSMYFRGVMIYQWRFVRAYARDFAAGLRKLRIRPEEP